MTIEEVKRFILDCREKGDTYEEIANKLNGEMCEKKYTRQSVYGLYSRYKASKKKEKEVNQIDVDIVNIYCRVQTVQGTIKALDSIPGWQVKMYADKVSKIINKRQRLKKAIEKELTDIVKDSIRIGDSLKEMKERLSYKGVDIVEKVLKNILINVYTELIKENVETIIGNSLIYDETKTVARKLIDNFPTGNSLTVLVNKETKKK